MGLLALLVAVALLPARKATQIELFEAAEIVCPTEAKRGPDGLIHVNPGNRTFPTLSDYTSYLYDLYARGAKCLPPKVVASRDAPLGILGGLGTDTISPAGVKRETATRAVLDFNTADEETSAKTPINKLDDYEYSRIEQSERPSRNELSGEVKSALMEQHNLDWANLPFNSEARAASEDTFVAGRMDNMYKDPKTGVFFKNMEGSDILPPDEEATKQREARILASYRPTDLTEHKVDRETESVAKLVNQMYAGDKHWQPVVSRTGENKWEVTELIPKARKETWEDAQAMTVALATEKGFVTPKPEVNVINRLQDDPYFDKSGVADNANNRFWNYKDFNKWTPGLERMFAPTMDERKWY